MVLFMEMMWGDVRGLTVELRSWARQAIGPALAVLAVLYFGYHAVHGERGLLAWWHLRHEVTLAKAELATVRAARMTLEHRVSLLNPSSLDPDMLEERARVMLNYGRADDIVIITTPQDHP